MKPPAIVIILFFALCVLCIITVVTYQQKGLGAATITSGVFTLSALAILFTAFFRTSDFNEKISQFHPKNWDKNNPAKNPVIPIRNLKRQPMGLEKNPRRVLTSSNPKTQHALNSLETYLNSVVEEVGREAERLKFTNESNIALSSTHGSGKRSILRIFANSFHDTSKTNIYDDLFFFDASISPPENLHEEFIFWLGKSLNIQDEIARLNECVVASTHDEGIKVLEEINGRLPRHKRFALTIAESNRIYEVTNRGSLETERTAIHLLENFLKNSQVDVLVSLKNSSDKLIDNIAQTVDPLTAGDWETKKIAALTHILGTKNLSKQILENLSFEDCISLILLLGMTTDNELEPLLRKIENSKDRSVISQLAYEGVKSKLTHFGELSEYIIYVLSKVDWPLSENELLTLITECVHLCNSRLSIETQIDITSAYNHVRADFVDFGLIHVLRGAVKDQYFYYVPDTARSKLNKRTLEADELSELDTVRKKIAEKRAAEKPTELSKLLSRGQFQSVGTRLAAYDNDYNRLSIPLGASTIGAISPAMGVKAIRSTFLIQSHSKITEAQTVGQFAVILSTADSPINDYWYIRIHVVNRKGSGQDVLEILNRDIGEVVSINGDAHRLGPGGVVEAIVRINDELAERDAENSVDEVARSLRESLQSNIDTYADVKILKCYPTAVRDALEDDALRILGDDILVKRSNAQFMNSEGILEIGGSALMEISKVYEQTNRSLQNLQIQCYVSRPIGQAILVFPNFSDLNTVSVYLWSKPEKSDSGLTTDESSEIAKTFMKLASDLELNLVFLRPIGFFGCRADFEVSRALSVEKIQKVRKHLETKNINITILDDGDVDNSVGVGEDAWASMTPETYHIEMRKHLFLPEADASVVTLVNLVRSNLLKELEEEPTILELGAGTGALTAKLANSGIYKLDFLEPSKNLSDYWEKVVVKSCSGWEGKVFNCGIEDLSRHNKEPYDLILSQGVHHHLMPEAVDGKDLRSSIEAHRVKMMDTLAERIKKGGYAIISDEFVLGAEDSEAERIENLDKWYQTVIATALFQGNPQLAQMEHSFWRSDRSGIGEYKESISSFENRLAKMKKYQFSIQSITKYGFTKECPGGFAIYLLKREK